MKPLFRDISLSENDYFRAVILYGRNVASYKFALAESILTFAIAGRNFVSLEDLSVPFSDSLCRHLQIQDKQSTAPTSTFLEALRNYNIGEIDSQQKYETTTRLGFTNVIDAFHVVGRSDVPVRFFHDDRGAQTPGITLTDELLKMASYSDSGDLIKENESRWRLVETAWAYNLPKRLVTVDYDEKLDKFFAIDNEDKRQNVTNAAPALNGYQRGKCFYCNKQIHLGDWKVLEERAEVDHFFPHVLQRTGALSVDLDQAWNLVLACNKCNGASEKSDACPDLTYVEDIHRRNENWI